jgi:hypothetical protein
MELAIQPIHFTIRIRIGQSVYSRDSVVSTRCIEIPMEFGRGNLAQFKSTLERLIMH